jgi:hypothetical protein
MTIHNKPIGQKAVCTQAEWDVMQIQRPGYHKLLQSGITSEREAELIARGHVGRHGEAQLDAVRWQKYRPVAVGKGSPRIITSRV